MSAVNYGKKFETKFKLDFLKIKDATIDRLYDQVSEYKNLSNICDFIGYKEPNIYYLECKSHKGNTFPFQALRQYDALLSKVGVPGVRTGVVIWFIDHDRVIYVPIKTIEQMKKDNKKSVNITTIEKDGYRFIEIPSIKKRVFLDSDYSVLLSLNDED